MGPTWLVQAHKSPGSGGSFSAHQEGAGYIGLACGHQYRGRPTPTFREQTQVLLIFLNSGNYQWGSWPLVRPGPGEQGARKSREPGGRQCWEALGPGAKQRTCAGCGESGLGLRALSGLGSRGLACVGVDSYLSRTAFSFSTLYPSLPKKEPGD